MENSGYSLKRRLRLTEDDVAERRPSLRITEDDCEVAKVGSTF